MTRAIAVLVLAAAAAPVAIAQEPAQPPRFTASVEVTAIDATVVDDRGKPVIGLTPGDFSVRIDGSPRRVVSAQWMPTGVEANADKPAPPPLPAGYSSNARADGGRLILLVVDQPNIRFGGARALVAAAGAFIDRLSSSDRVAVVGLGFGATSTPFTADRARARQAIARMNGQKQARAGGGDVMVAVSEALAIERGDSGMLDAVAGRECAGMNGMAVQACRQTVETEAQMVASTAKNEGDVTIRGLRDLLNGLKRIDAPKTLVLMSEGFVMDDRSPEVMELGALASASRTSIYALKLDDQAFDMSDMRAPTARGADRAARSAGLETLVGAARGGLFTVTGTGAGVFERIESELSGYYLIGVEAETRDREGKPRSLKVDVGRRGVTVRARRQIFPGPGDERSPLMPRDAVMAGLTSPLILSELPLRVATFSLLGPEAGKVQILIHADVGADYVGSKPVSLAYMITDATGRLVDSRATDARLAPLVRGVPSALEYTSGASLAPGDYTLKLAAADGDRVGTVEHVIHASVIEAGTVRLSDLMVGDPADRSDLLQPSVGAIVSYGRVHGYLEAYGTALESLKVRYELAASETSPALAAADVPGRLVDGARALFTLAMPTSSLPAGKYVLRAVVSAPGAPPATLTRAFDVAPPAVLMSSAAGFDAASPSVDAELFLPVADALLAPPFERDQALEPSVVRPFRDRLAPGAKNAFEQGLAALGKGDYVAAELSLKKAIQPDVDSAPGLTYLAVCYAASGHDTEAAAAWQTALADGAELPQIYLWLSAARMRAHDMGEARSILEEALQKWPADARFARPLAMLYGTFGRGREAVRTIERYISAGNEDADSLFMALEWLYHVHAAGAVAFNRSQDLKLAHGWADAYARARGPQQALVQQWLDFLEHGKP